ncbi:MAG: sensor histidine kinase [Gemmatimonadales bacterium]|nr:MAG: sensor histidine kinase [Gemmatimonadales bacterium]
MEVLAWSLVVVLTIVVVVLLLKRKSAAVPAGSSVREVRELSTGGSSTAHGSSAAPADTTEAGTATAPAPADGHAGPGSHAADPARSGRTETASTRAMLESVLGFLERGPLSDLREAESGGSLPGPVLDALDALEDLAFYGRIPDPTTSKQSLEHLVRDVTREYTDEHGVRVRVSGPERLVSFTVAPEWFKDVLYLVLANAHHYGGDGQIEVRLSGGAAVPAVVEVRDEGEGFSDEALEHAFEPFWTSDERAPGLGLFHCRILVDRMGGELEIDNHPDGGGRVRLLLPEAPPAGDGQDTRSARPPADPQPPAAD